LFENKNFACVPFAANCFYRSQYAVYVGKVNSSMLCSDGNNYVSHSGTNGFGNECMTSSVYQAYFIEQNEKV